MFYIIYFFLKLLPQNASVANFDHSAPAAFSYRDGSVDYGTRPLAIEQSTSNEVICVRVLQTL